MEEILTYFLMPSNVTSLLLLMGCLVWLLGFSRFARLCLIGAIAIYVFFGCGPVSQYLLADLEYRYPAFNAKQTSPTTIVVLTGGSENKPGTSLSSLSNPSSTYRIIEASILYRALPNRRIIITGEPTTAVSMKDELIGMGIPNQAITIDDPASSTYISATNLANKLKQTPFILVTSAGHMPRSMAAFESQGMHPIPAPTEFLTHQNIFAAAYLPNAHHLVNSDLAIHEHLALLWYRWSGKI